MNYIIERTDEEVVIRFPIDTNVKSMQNVLDYLSFVGIASKSKATQEQIDELADEVQQNWWDKNKHRFEGLEGFKEFT